MLELLGLFSGRGYNIESLAVAEVDQKKKSFKSYNCNYWNTPEVIQQIALTIKKISASS